MPVSARSIADQIAALEAELAAAIRWESVSPALQRQILDRLLRLTPKPGSMPPSGDGESGS